LKHRYFQRVREILDDEEYRALQNALALNPESGKIMQGSGGILNCGGLDQAEVRGKVLGSYIIGLQNRTMCSCF